MKRIISIALALVMVLSVAVVAVSAAEVSNPVGADSNNSAGADTSSSTTGSGDMVYFDASGWKNVTMIYCHIWKRGGDAFIGWQLKKEACKKVSGNKWSYDLANLDASTTMSGGLKSGEDYCIIFSAQTGKQTYDATFSKACVGDTLKLTGKLIENPVDSEKKADEAVWSKNSGSYGPHLAFTSIGNIVGSKLCPNEKGTEVIGDWLPTYYKSKFVKAVPALAKAFPKFGITSASQIQDIYAYIISKKTGEDEKAMKKMLEDAFAKAYPAKKNEAKIDENKAKNEAKQISSNGGHISSSSSASSSSSSSGSSYSGSSSSNSSGSGSDGEEDTILFILLGVMLAAAGVIFVTRRKRTE
ncbi:MAG: LPXTG cell wall anchor domain-containing protein [Ruminococcus sp.]|nr:LPXTG cell wall anchor domain-containing protein [Ruminococcus sp.]